MPASNYAQKLRSIAAAWPADPFRPNMQLKTFLDSLAAHPRLSPDVVQSARVLLENRVQHRYPLSAKTLEPASMPKHYERLVQGYERSAKGIRRPWWQVFFETHINILSEGQKNLVDHNLFHHTRGSLPDLDGSRELAG